MHAGVQDRRWGLPDGPKNPMDSWKCARRPMHRPGELKVLADLYRRDVLGTGAFRTLAYGIGHLPAFMQGGETDALEGRFMEEQVFVSLRLDEPEILACQLLDGTRTIVRFRLRMAAGVDCLVSNDAHLLAIGPCEGMRIISMDAYYRLLVNEGLLSDD